MDSDGTAVDELFRFSGRSGRGLRDRLRPRVSGTEGPRAGVRLLAIEEGLTSLASRAG